MKSQSFENISQIDTNLSFWKEENPREDKRVEQFFAERVVIEEAPLDVSREMVNHVALSRLSQLIEEGRKTLKGIFTYEEFRNMLHANAQPWWKEDLWGDVAWSAANSIHDEFMDEREYSPEVQVMFKKIQDLDKFQRFILVDLLECAWRSKKDPMAYALNETQLNN